MITIEEARYILRDLDAADIVRRAWRASLDAEGESCYAAVVLDLRTARIRIDYWPPESLVLRDWGVIVLAEITAVRRDDAEAEANRRTKVAPSADVVVEGEVERAAQEGLNWGEIEQQLRKAYQLTDGDLGAA